ncbi:hypothetical protein CCACVL1_24442 [Corchorus capsularis]|uniref:Uncharacterized protein n=1 Tax=Corchorus capsularis TaxID=210143 RepID=A0A1R3GPK9_COCAP|nr:hypothetical protein CCACVL1_24442 [Corchorus capsularis]
MTERTKVGIVGKYGEPEGLDRAARFGTKQSRRN